MITTSLWKLQPCPSLRVLSLGLHDLLRGVAGTFWIDTSLLQLVGRKSFDGSQKVNENSSQVPFPSNVFAVL